MAYIAREEVWGQATTFTIEEYPGNKPDSQSLWLTGRGLPKPPYELGGKLRADFTWYAGATTATVQILGTEEDSTTITGVWSTRFLGDTTVDYVVYNGAPVKTARAAATALETMARRGQLVEVKWDETSRWGFITKWSVSWTRSEDLEWELEFTWASAFAPDPPQVIVETSDASATQAKAKAAVAILSGAVGSDFSTAEMLQAIAQGTVTGLLGFVGAAIAVVAGVISLVTSIIRAATKLVVGLISGISSLVVGIVNGVAGLLAAPGEMAKAIAAAYTQAKEAMKQAWEEALARVATAYTSSTDTTAPGSTNPAGGPQPGGSLVKAQVVALPPPTAAQRAAAQTTSWTVMRAARTTARTLGVCARETLANDPSEVYQAIYTAREGDDLRQVSWIYYDTPDLWLTLAKVNNLQSSALTAGQQVFVPLQAGALRGPRAMTQTPALKSPNNGSTR